MLFIPIFPRIYDNKFPQQDPKPQTLIACHCPVPVRKSHHIEVAEGKREVRVRVVAVGADGACKELVKVRCFLAKVGPSSEISGLC